MEPVGRVNLIAGKNGSGKTSLLEALWMLGGPDMPELGLRVDLFRGLPPPSPAVIFRDLFNDFDTSHTIRIFGQEGEKDTARELRIYLREHLQSLEIPQPVADASGIERSTRPQTEGEYEIVFDYDDGLRQYLSLGWWSEQTLPFPSPFPGLTPSMVGLAQNRQAVEGRPNSTFMAASSREDLIGVASRFGELQMEGLDSQILELLQPLEPGVTGLTTITVGTVPVVYALFKGRRPVPIRLMGEGFNRMFELATVMGSSQGGFLLIDEIENGLHHSLLDQVFSNLWSMAKAFDVQVFATTHSMECIESAYAAVGHMEEREYTFHRLDRTESGVKAVRYKPSMMRTAIEMNMDVR